MIYVYIYILYKVYNRSDTVAYNENRRPNCYTS